MSHLLEGKGTQTGAEHGPGKCGRVLCQSRAANAKGELAALSAETDSTQIGDDAYREILREFRRLSTANQAVLKLL